MQMIKFLILFLISGYTFADLIPAEQAKSRSKEVLRYENSRCVTDWEKEIEDSINLAVENGRCKTDVTVDSCITKKFLKQKIKKLKDLGYKVSGEGYYYVVTWCEEN